CYGLQLMNFHLGGSVEKKAVREDGQFDIQVETDSLLFDGLDSTQQVLLTHGDTADKLPEGFRQIADSNGLVAGIESADKKLYAVQFHPEVDLTTNGMQIYSNFLFKIAQLKADFTVEDREAKAIREIKQTIGDKNALILLSGGVDSTVTAALLSKALKPEQIFAIHIDTGFMRENESEMVIEALTSLGLQVRLILAEDDFMEATTIVDGKETLPLSETTNPEHKRKIIGDTFIKVAEEALAEYKLDPEETFLVQGTLRPDLIESASKMASSNAETIKTHHNDTQLVRDLRDKGRVVEPLHEYHKDEVRKLGEILGLPSELVWRQPFPGPGLAIRVICAQEPFVEKYDEVFEKLKQFETEEIKATLLPI
ncbi:MAG: GMP synthase (glutamine-hydrolyzing), partial [Candidatus Pacebacteria bacterium CG10_big_fil_rev_8_21_14_0_10_42_12]